MFVYLFASTYLLLFKFLILEVLANISVLDQGIFPLEKGSIGLQFYIDLENLHHTSTCKVNSFAKMCCLSEEEYKDCSKDYIHGDSVQYVHPKKRSSIVYVYPTLYQHDQIGYCDFVIDYRCGAIRRSRQIGVNIPFDTTMTNRKKKLYLRTYTDQRTHDCETLDEDSLHGCDPVNCDLKYSGRRPFFEIKLAKCVSAPVCDTNLAKDLPDLVYVPKSNICRDLDHPITLGDIYAMSTGLGIVTESTRGDYDDFKVLLKSNCSTISQNLNLLRDLMYGKLCPIFKGDTSEYKDCCSKAILAICWYIGAICALLLAIVCFIHTSFWVYGKYSTGELKETVTNWCVASKSKSDGMYRASRINRDVTNNLLREVIVRDLPVEMRESIVDVCQRIDNDIKRKKRYRVLDLGSQVDLRQSDSSHSSDSSP